MPAQDTADTITDAAPEPSVDRRLLVGCRLVGVTFAVTSPVPMAAGATA
ncbi:hypothetical protein [Mycobacterium sp. Marseille-P9652]|nr:hypothetical protein [Mycobacterium sp. Marseille-P9652]